MAFDEGLADRIRRVLSAERGVTEKRMFGGLAFLWNGHMVCGVVKSNLMLRLGEDGVVSALRKPHTLPMDFTGKPMKSMLYVDAPGLDSDDALEAWIQSAVRFVSTLPPK